MPFIPVPNVVSVSIRMTQQDELTENTLYFRPLNVGGIGAMTILADTIVNWWDTSLAQSLPQSTELREVYVVDLSTANGPTYTSVPSGSVSGVLVADALPNNATIAISFRTANRGRSYRGRNYIPGLAETEVSNNRLSNTRVTALVNAYIALNVGTFAQDWQHVVVSRYSNNVPRNVGIATDVVNYVIVDPVIDSQRRRLPGRGR